MNDIKEFIDKYNLKVKKYSRTSNAIIIDTDRGSYAIKEKKRADKEEIFNYLKSKQFNYFLTLHNDIDDKYEMVPFVNDNVIEHAEKGPELMYVMSLLHNKTAFYKRVALDETKAFYEEKSTSLEDIKEYYDNMLWIMEEQSILAPSNYFLQRNISLIYKSIDVALLNLEQWYEVVKDKETKRVAMTHNRIDDSHLLIDDKPYLISWDNCCVDLPVYDFYNFFKLNYLKFDCFYLFTIYNSRFELSKEEVYFLFYLLATVEKIDFMDTEINNTKQIHDYIRYLHYVSVFISKYNSKYENEKPD